MSTQVTFMLLDDVYSSALRLARLTHREVTDVLRDLLTLACRRWLRGPPIRLQRFNR